MPTYPYFCKSCEFDFDVTKRISEIDEVEICPKCDEESVRLVALCAIEKSSAAQPYYEPALGCVIKSKSQKKHILREKGLEEIGNTSPESLYKQLEIPRQKKLEKSWDDV